MVLLLRGLFIAHNQARPGSTFMWSQVSCQALCGKPFAPQVAALLLQTFTLDIIPCSIACSAMCVDSPASGFSPCTPEP